MFLQDRQESLGFRISWVSLGATATMVGYILFGTWLVEDFIARDPQVPLAFCIQEFIGILQIVTLTVLPQEFGITKGLCPIRLQSSRYGPRNY